MDYIKFILFISNLSFIHSLALSVNKISAFPHLLNKPFNAEIIPNLNGNTLTSDPSDTMVTRIIDQNLNEKQKHHFYFGSQDSVDSEFKGKYMDILSWEKNTTENKITLSMMFKLISHDMFIEIFMFSASDKLKKLKFLKDLNLAKNLLHQRINLFYPTKLNLLINSLNNNNINNTNLLFPRDEVVATCRAYDGFPIRMPNFTIPDGFIYRRISFDKFKLESKMYFLVSSNIHLQKLICKAGNTSRSVNIYISHHPTSIFVEPKIDKLVEPNTRLRCFVKDGYPSPEVTWQFVSGPRNASMFYKIISYGSQLYMKSNSPIKSSWTFKCSVKSYSNITERIISFSIAVHPARLYVEPEIIRQIHSNLTMSCFIKEEDLNPEIKWQLVKGPQNASLYFDILKNGSELYMNTNNLPGTKWTFRCIVKTVLTTTKIMNKTISFVIAKYFMKCDEKCVERKFFEWEKAVERNNKLYIFLNQLSKTFGILKNDLNAKKDNENPIPILLSLNKPTEQSSDFHGYGKLLKSKLAVDGDHCQNVRYDGCSHTNYNFRAFWMVDLEEFYIISEVVIYNRVDCCQERLVGATIEVLSNNNEIIGDCGIISESKNEYSIKCYSMIGQKIRIRLNKSDYLTLCEVDVFGWLKEY